MFAIIGAQKRVFGSSRGFVKGSLQTVRDINVFFLHLSVDAGTNNDFVRIKIPFQSKCKKKVSEGKQKPKF